MAEGLDPVSESVALWVQVPDMWLAFVSMALFIAVVVTSLVAVRRRFPYEFWYVVHLLTYAAVLTSIPHQFSVGGLFAEGTWQRWYWLAICIATGAALVYFRVLEPMVATLRHQLTVGRVVAGGPGRGQHRDDGPAPGPSWPEAADGSSSGGSWPRACGGIRTRSACPPSRSVRWPDGSGHAADHRPEPWPRLRAAGSG